MLLKVLILFLLHESAIAQMHSYIGNQLSVEEYKKLDLCELKVCLEDSLRITSYASDKKNSDPCVNFDDFACGGFNKIQLKEDLKVQRLETILSQDINEDEPKAFKVMKKYFQKCIHSNEGKAETLNLLAEYGKFPQLKSNWNSSDFNLTKAVIAMEERTVLMSFNTYEVVKDMLNMDLGLSPQKTSEILNDFEEDKDDFTRAFMIYWRDQIGILYESEFVLEMTLQECYDLLELENKKKLANTFMMVFLMQKIDFFSVNSRPEICIKQLQKTMKLPLSIMYELKHKKDVDEVAFRDFIKKVFGDLKTPIYIGLPVEFTTTEFLNDVFKNLMITGDEGVYEMYQDMGSLQLTHKEGEPDIFRTCAFSDPEENCFKADEFFVFRIDNIIYPMFHPDRPHYVNLGSLFHQLKDLSSFNMQSNYQKYLENFGVEQSLPGFLMSNQQMMELIQYQNQCSRDRGTSDYNPSVFNC